jgi:hypothetical protein
MAAKGKFGKASGKASEAAKAAQGNQYLQRLIEDEELRSSLASAYDAARSAYGRLGNGKPAHEALMSDRKLQEEIKQALGALRDAGGSLREEPAKAARKSRKRKPGRSLLVLAFGAVLAIALSEGLRTKLLDLMFGAEEQFDYSSTTTPASPEPAGVTGA